MNYPARAFAVVLKIIAVATLPGCVSYPGTTAPNPIVGSWLVTDPNAPFPLHIYVFNADGTMQQANPDAGDPRASDSDGKGIWIATGSHVTGKWVEVIADRATHQLTGRLEVTFDFKVSADGFTGRESIRAYDEHGSLTSSAAGGAEMMGERIKL